MNAQVQIIEKNGQPEYAVIPIDQYRRLLALAEDTEDFRAAERAVAELVSGEDELIPGDIVDKLFSGEPSPVLVWREYRGLTQEALAKKAGVGSSYISQIESGKKPGSVTVLKKIATALRVSIDDLVITVNNNERA
ncbi:helix-turn-helix domain-containing protein [Thiolapillus sp.]